MVGAVSAACDGRRSGAHRARCARRWLRHVRAARARLDARKGARQRDSDYKGERGHGTIDAAGNRDDTRRGDGELERDDGIVADDGRSDDGSHVHSSADDRPCRPDRAGAGADDIGGTPDDRQHDHRSRNHHHAEHDRRSDDCAGRRLAASG